MSLFFPTRAVESTVQQLIATGAAGAYGVDPIDGDRGYTPIGQSPKDQPRWTTEKQRAYSIASYRSNPMGRAIIDTYTSFVVGDSGVKPMSDDAQVRAVLDEWWTDPRNRYHDLQTLLCRDWMITGEVIHEYLVGPTSGSVQFSPISPSRVVGVNLERGNPLWHESLEMSGQAEPMPVARLDAFTGLRSGAVGYFPSWRTLITDRRGTPFLGPVLDDLDAYAQVLSNLVDRTALARYMAFDVTVKGGPTDIAQFIKDRGGVHAPASGSAEVHNESVTWQPMNVSSGSFEDTNTATAILTNVAGGSGLAKTWLSESEGANRATAMSMAEPVRRRVGGVQVEWLGILTEMARFAIDQAVTVGRLPRQLSSTDEAGDAIMVAPSQLVRVTGPEIAAADAMITSNVMLNLSTAIDTAIKGGFMSPAAAGIAMAKAWEQLVGRPMPPALIAEPLAKISPDSIAEEIDAAHTEGRLIRVV